MENLNVNRIVLAEGAILLVSEDEHLSEDMRRVLEELSVLVSQVSHKMQTGSWDIGMLEDCCDGLIRKAKEVV